MVLQNYSPVELKSELLNKMGDGDNIWSPSFHGSKFSLGIVIASQGTRGFLQELFFKKLQREVKVKGSPNPIFLAFREKFKHNQFRPTMKRTHY